MRDLDKNKVYDLSELTSEEYNIFLKETDNEDVKQRFNYYYHAFFSNILKEDSNIVNAKELFYTLENVYIRPLYVHEAEVETFAKIAPPDIFKERKGKTPITYEKFMELFNNPINHEVKVKLIPQEVIEFLVNKKVFLSPEDYKKLFD